MDERFTEVKTPSHIPNRTGCEMKKLDFHHGFSPCRPNNTKHECTELLAGTIRPERYRLFRTQQYERDGQDRYSLQIQYLLFCEQLVSPGILSSVTGFVEDGRFRRELHITCSTVLIGQAEPCPVHLSTIRIAAAARSTVSVVFHGNVVGHFFLACLCASPPANRQRFPSPNNNSRLHKNK